MEEQLSPLAVTHLLQHTLRSLCILDNSQWVYAVFWRILPRNYPPPKILVWEDGFCNFAASTAEIAATGDGTGSSSDYGSFEYQNYQLGLQPELFFKMSHEIYNYGEGLIGKVAADHSHKWIYKEPNEQEINFLSSWQNSADSQPRTWEAQFQSGIKVIEDLSYVVLLRKKFNYIESIPGVLLPHPSSSSFPFKIDGYSNAPDQPWHFPSNHVLPPHPPTTEIFYDQYHFNYQPAMRITPSMSSLEALLSKLPSVVPPHTSPPASAAYCEAQAQQPVQYVSSDRDVEMIGMEKVAKEEIDIEEEEEEEEGRRNNDKDHVGESSSSMTSYYPTSHQQWILKG
ncbi:hypothetical protein RHMOL_Rhmol12G0143500 [Rhododendron molle]|uniref:Uncharacterized protein n=1 Tax=Rhododendron molle TaxID=49168 RepID=A0ACC0LJ69_RHOML|nr:hypothetical protein RHMOL_Rhmol12G0143500 [Rhododendron molle]